MECTVLVAMLLLAPRGVSQAARVKTARVRPNLIVGDTLTVTATPSAVSFALVHGGVAMGSGPVAITSTFAGISLLSSFALYGYFASATSALSGGTPVSNIPSSCVLGLDPQGTPTTFTPFTQTGPFGGAGAGLQLFSINVGVSLGGSRTDNLSLEINLTTLPQLPAATYTGTITLEAQAF